MYGCGDGREEVDSVRGREKSTPKKVEDGTPKTKKKKRETYQ